MEPLIITPRTKIDELLKAYPELEDTLINASPPFRRLKNPILRKTIARVTTLSQAAIIGGVNVEELINILRTSAGQEIGDSYPVEEASYNYNQPDWFSSGAIRSKIEISELLNAGEQPIHEVLSFLKKLTDNEILEIEAPFLPAPLIDKSISLGYRHWICKKDSEYYIYISKKT